LNTAVKDEYKPLVKAEVIFLTHNEKKHEYNLKNELSGEELLKKIFDDERETILKKNIKRVIPKVSLTL
jgi:hypothetical protein